MKISKIASTSIAFTLVLGFSCAESSFSQTALQWSVDYFDATTVSREAKGFQLADYDRRGNRVLFYPWGGIVSRPSSVLLAYHTSKDFKSKGSYEAVDLAEVVDPDAQGFGTGFIDENSNWSYLVPFRKRTGLFGQKANDLAIRFNLSKKLNDKEAYETFRLSSMPKPPPQLGWITGVAAKDYVFFLPYGTPVTGKPWHKLHGNFLRYDSRKSFNDPLAWSWVDLKKFDARAEGFQSIAVKGSSLYLIPYYPERDILLRYDLSKPFEQKSSYEIVEMTKLHPKATGYTGTVLAGHFLVLVPWRNINESNPGDALQSAHWVAAYDTRKSVTDKKAWSFFDLTQLDPGARGYQFGWFDKNGFVHLVPTHDFATKLPPPFVSWNTSKPLADVKSWVKFPRGKNLACTGAAYDGEFAFLAPYGHAGNSGLITRIKFK